MEGGCGGSGGSHEGEIGQSLSPKMSQLSPNIGSSTFFFFFFFDSATYS